MKKSFLWFAIAILLLMMTFSVFTVNAASWGSKLFAPYAYLSSSFSIINDSFNATGQKYYTLAFIVSDGSGNPVWDGGGTVSSGIYASDISSLRSKGGDVIVSFGGAAGTELAISNTSASTLQSKYQQVIDKYGLTWLDYDIEGSTVGNSTYYTRRNTAIAGLQSANPGLKISFTVSVMPSGLGSDVISMLSDAKAKGVKIESVDIMTFDYGAGYANNVANAEQAAQSAKNQLANIDSTIKVGIIEMIGQDDTGSPFYQSDATTLLNWANNNSWIRLLSFWCSNRDRAGASGMSGSGISQNTWDFTNIFKAYSGGTSPTPTPTSIGNNLALNKPAYCSSADDASRGAAQAVDGNTSTRWASAWASDPQWIYVDLGATYSINRVRLNWEAAYGKSYQIQTSADATNWTTVYSTTTGDGGIDDINFSATSARYVRMYGTVRALSQYGYSLWEFEVYGGGTVATPTATRTPTATPASGNLALNKPAYASSVEAAGFEAGKAFDGSVSTRWSSAYSDNQSLWVDLGSNKTVAHVKLRWESAYAKSYQIQTSTDGSTWTTAADDWAGAGGTVDKYFTATTARYVKIYCITRATSYGFSLWEFEVYAN